MMQAGQVLFLSERPTLRFAVLAIALLIVIVGSERFFSGMSSVVTSMTSNAFPTAATLPFARLTHTINPSATNSIKLGRLLLQQQQYGDAEEVLGSAVAKFPEAKQIRFELAKVLLVQGKHHEAASRASEEISLFPDSYKAYYTRGLAYSFQGFWDLAVTDFQFFIDHTPFAPWPRIDLSWSYLAIGNPVAAEEVLQDVLTHDPTNAWALNNLGLAYMHQGNLDKAGALFDQTLAATATLQPDQFRTAYPEQNLQRFPASQKALEAGVFFNKGVLAEKRGLVGEAVAYYKEAIAISPDSTVGDVNKSIIQNHIQELSSMP